MKLSISTSFHSLTIILLLFLFLQLQVLFEVYPVYVDLESKVDTDLDGVPNLREIALGTNPFLRDQNPYPFYLPLHNILHTSISIKKESPATAELSSEVIYDSGFNPQVHGFSIPNMPGTGYYEQNGLCFGYGTFSVLQYLDRLPIQKNKWYHILPYDVTPLYAHPTYDPTALYTYACDSLYGHLLTKTALPVQDEALLKAIRHWFWKQSNPFWFYKNFHRMTGTAEDLDRIKASIAAGIPVVVCFEKLEGSSIYGHTVIIYKLKEFPLQQKIEMYVYDLNFPGGNYLYNPYIPIEGNDLSAYLKIDLQLDSHNKETPYTLSYMPFTAMMQDAHLPPPISSMLDTFMTPDDLTYGFSTEDPLFCFYFTDLTFER